jgi:8-oxo-dGTP pyrophosphatase MutT (NUDIX family)
MLWKYIFATMAASVTMNTPLVDASTEARLAFHHALPSSRLGKENESLESFRKAVVVDASTEARLAFRHALPSSRLGQEHASLESFRKAAEFVPAKQKEYSLVVITEPASGRILLGEKHRGFGKGMHNSFGGKIEPGESDVESAKRELEEESGICVPMERMAQSKLGTLRFTFEDSPKEMVVHVFRINVSCDESTTSSGEIVDSIFRIDPSVIKGCDEITPVWFPDWYEIPLHNMFADDSVWLTRVLSSQEEVLVDGWFHFEPGGQEVNTILHYYMDFRPKNVAAHNNNPENRSAQSKGTPKASSYTLEQRLFHALHDNKIHSPSVKEFKESYAFANAVKAFIGRNTYDIVIDVAGGHGALAALFLVTTSARTAIVVDPVTVGGGGVSRAWGNFFQGKELRYRYECLRSGLPAELESALKSTRADRILVVACHACQHLSDEILDISCRHGVHAAVMPCCQKDPSSAGSSWKEISKKLNVPIEIIMDVLLAGKAMSWTTGEEAAVSYDVRMKAIDGSITPQNRLILCRAQGRGDEKGLAEKRSKAHDRLSRAYTQAHASAAEIIRPPSQLQGLHLVAGFALGYLVALALIKR